MLHQLVHLVVSNVVVLFMFAVGLQTRPRAIAARIRERPSVFAKGLVVLFGAIPLLTIAIAKLFGLPPRMAAVLVIFGVCPAAPLVIRKLAKTSDCAGQTALGLVAIASLLAPLLVPAWLEVVNRLFQMELHVSFGTLFEVILSKTLLPIAAGAFLGWAVPRIAPTLAKVCSGVATVALALMVVTLLKASLSLITHLTFAGIAALLLTVFGSAALGELAAAHDMDDREALATVAMTGSPALALAVVHTSYPDLKNVAGIVGTFILLRALAALPYRLFTKRRRARSLLHHPA